MDASYITPAITLFQKDGTLDLDGQGVLYDRLIQGGVDGILVQGSIGEFFALSMEQRRMMAKFSINAIGHRTRCIVGTASMVFEEIAPFSNYCLEQGADAVMIISPYYFRFEQDELYRFYDELLRHISGPIYIYNFPERTGYSIAPRTILRLAQKYSNLCGIKDTLTGVDHTREVIKAVKHEFPSFEVYSGFDDNAAHNVLSGGNGVIGGLSNVAPEVCAAWMQSIKENNIEGVISGQQKIDRLMDIYAVGSMFVPIIKEAARLRGIASSNYCSFPMPMITNTQSQAIEAILKASDLL